MPPPSVIFDTLLTAVLPALAFAAVIMAAVLLVRGSEQGPLAAAVGLIAGAGLGFWLKDGLVLISSDSAWNRLPAAALAAVWLGRVARFPQLHPNAGWLLRAATAIGVAWLVIPTDARKDADWLTPVFAALVFANWVILERLAAEPPGGTVPFCLAVVFLAVAGVVIHAGWERVMNAAIVLAAAFAGIAVVARLWRVDAGGAVPAAAVMSPGLLLMGKLETFTDVPWQAFALPAVAPLLLAEALPLSNVKSGRARLLLMLLMVLIPLAAALYMAHDASPLDFKDI
jgi:hypothetical protein